MSDCSLELHRDVFLQVIAGSLDILDHRVDCLMQELHTVVQTGGALLVVFDIELADLERMDICLEFDHLLLEICSEISQ